MENKKTVLVVDDQEGLVSLYRIALVRRGFNVVTATNGQEALDRVSEALPHIIVMDVNLPDMDGLTAAFRLRSATDTREIPILAISGQSAGELKDEAIHLGCINFLQKPFTLVELVGEVQRILAATSVRTN